MTLVIPFPAWHRTGHASKVAAQLAQARTNREADYALSRSMTTFLRQLDTAGIDPAEVEKQRIEYLMRIGVQCRLIGAGWMPELPMREKPGGAA